MDNPFFTALESPGFKASNLASQTEKVLMPFIHYLDNSINALEDKEVSCEWRPVAGRRYQLTPDKRIYQVTPVSQIEILSEEEGWYEILSEVGGGSLDENFVPTIEDPVIVGKGAERRRFVLEEPHYQSGSGQFKLYLPELDSATEVQWSGYQLSIRALTVSLEGLKEVHVDSHACKIKLVNRNCVHLYGQVNPQSTVTINGQNTRFEVIASLDDNQLESYSPRQNGTSWLLFAPNKPNFDGYPLKDVTSKMFGELVPEHLTIDGSGLSQELWSLENNDEGILVLEASDMQSPEFENNTKLNCTRFSEVLFSVSEAKVDEKWIQLVEKESGEETGKSDLDHFFGDNIKILDHTQRKFEDGFRVIKSRPEERQILLAKNTRGKKSWKSEYPNNQGKVPEIRVSVDTSQLKRQKEAINQLRRRPSYGHLPIIHLLQERQRVRWQDIQPESGIDWKVLTNSDFDGCDRQREFVGKALATPDFAILDGPPGTGKTTTILELIIQLVMQGKRVLLSASTHAAINNVLERIQEDSKLSQHIFPLRIGDESNAVGVEGFQFDNLHKQLKSSNCGEAFSKQLMVDASNLICGTTIGILRLFNEREVVLDRGEPPFDVMIIDECSKTTFQEFLVPARFAKRWILVGDVRQLSPFTDREQIVANLDNLMLTPRRGKTDAETLSPAIQQACFLLEELRGNNRNPYEQPMLVSVSKGVLKALNDEIEARVGSELLSKGLENILLIQSRRIRAHEPAFNQLTDMRTLEREPWRLYSRTLCFVDETCLSRLQAMLPDDMLMLHSDWFRTENAFLHKAAGQASDKSFTVKNSDISSTTEIHGELLDRIGSTKWSEQVCWRLEREYWLRLSSNKRLKNNYASTLDRLFPKSIKADGRIHILKNIAFPSILEALSGDGLQKRKNDDPITLNQGFKKHEKKQRHSTLTYQHRMHPDISSFPRSQFYEQGVLLDGSKTRGDRDWEYNRYKKRNTWLDVQGSVFRNVNTKEVEAIVHELKLFCEWAEGKRKNKKDEAYDVAVLTFYKGQEKALREMMQKSLPGNNNRYARFNYKGISIKLATVDYFQGQEADLVFLSMVNTSRDGFMDSPNRLNVSITRARYQLVVVGSHNYFSQRSRTKELSELATSSDVVVPNKMHNKRTRRNRK
ncbi:AAA domain-containing protein [Vibrio sp. CAU 1672]|uniref:AAA domain-containing protein n=1 Tax=Vibrio sp. CAU 1672 TaxID=3032594 RepID=UPI0023DB1FE5|nr:AAA domain-containing protein [Vibrio sp. CAU 1672]MDF2152535.1 AAA domain-containing protein [Vibrio sp. CAU 1672]